MKKGFALIEIIIVLAIISVVGVSVVVINSQKNEINIDNINQKIIEAATVFAEIESDSSNKKYITQINNGAKGLKIPLKTLVQTGYIDESYTKIIYETYKTEKILNNNEDYYVLLLSEGYCEDGNIAYYVSWKMTENQPVYLCQPKPVQEIVCGDYTANKDSLTCKIMNDSNITRNSGTPSFVNTATTEEGMYSAEDDYGKSWYFRGAQSCNYVKFAGFTWRIVRINGDGTIRLILDDFVRNSDNSVLQITFNTSSNSNAHVGYMFGQSGSYNYDLEHKNTNSSTVKQKIDGFYVEHLKVDEEYLADTLFCGDKKIHSGVGYNTNYTIYSANKRLENNNPTLECAKDESNTYSRYTVNENETTKGVKTNGNLTYPIGLMSADEVMLAGGATSKINNNWYLHLSTGDYQWWTMTPSFYYSLPYGFDIYDKENTLDTNANLYNTSYASGNHGAVRPVINIKKEVLVISGTGTSADPYKLSLN